MKIETKDIFLKQILIIPKNPKHFSFLPARKKVEKAEKIDSRTEKKEKHLIHIRALKQALNHELKLKKVHRVIQYKQKTWLKIYEYMNTELRKKCKE